MTAFEMPDWGRMFVPQVPLAESFLRGTLVYFALLVVFRVVMKRQAGSLGLPDLLLAVLVGACLGRALDAAALSPLNGLTAVAALVFWSYALDRLGVRYPLVHRLLHPCPVPLVRDGTPLPENLEAEGITEADLAAKLRNHGIADVAGAKQVVLESDGSVSVIPADAKKPGDEGDAPSDPPPVGGAEFDAAVGRFLAAAAELQAELDWHEARAAEHREAAKAARQVLARHGVRARRRAEEPT